MFIDLRLFRLLGFLALTCEILARKQCVDANTGEVGVLWITSFLHYENVFVPVRSAPVGHVNFTSHTELNNFTMTCGVEGTDISWLDHRDKDVTVS